MHLFLTKWKKLLHAYQRTHLMLLALVIMVPLLLNACSAAKNTSAAQPLVLTPLSTSSENNSTIKSTVLPTNTAQPAATATPAATLTSTATALPTATVTAQPTAAAPATQASTSAAVAAATPTTVSFFYNMAADIQNNVNGILEVLNIAGVDGEADIIIRNTYKDRQYQYNASYNLVKYLSIYFKGLSNPDLARLFGGTQFSLHVKSISIDNEYIVDTTTTYAELSQVAQAQVDQGQWEALVNAQIQMQYHVIALCSVAPNSITANTDTPLLISAWITYQSKPIIIQYVKASWKDSNGIQMYCAGNAYDSTCHGSSGNVKSGGTVTVDVAIQAYDGMNYSCQTSYTAP